MTKIEDHPLPTQSLCFVDALANWPATDRWTRGKSCHLFVAPGTPIEFLQQFGASMGMKQEWLQISKRGVPHFDLDLPRREIALSLGAVELDLIQTVEIIRRYREQTRKLS